MVVVLVVGVFGVAVVQQGHCAWRQRDQRQVLSVVGLIGVALNWCNIQEDEQLEPNGVI